MKAMLRDTHFSEAELDEAVRRLVQAFDPERIYIFGSRARGDFKDTSDLDLMVVVPDSTPAEKRQGAGTALAGLYLDHDVKVSTRSSFDKQLHLRASMPSAVLREGRLLYSKDGSASLVPEGATSVAAVPLVRETELPESDPVHVGNTRDWLERALVDLRGAAWHAQESSEAHLGQALFHCQQTVEKSLKAFLTWQDYPPPRRHNLLTLADACLDFDESLQAVVATVNWLSDWSVIGRYPTNAAPATRAQVEQGLQLANSVYEGIFTRLPDSVTDGLALP